MDEKEKNLTPTASPTPEATQPPVETSPMVAPEASQGQEQAQAVSQSGASAEVVQEPGSEATEVVSMEQKPVGAEKPAKKSHKGLVIGIVVAVVLVIGVVVAWRFLAGLGKTEESRQETDEIVSDGKNPSSSGSLKPISTKPNSGGSSSAVTIKLTDVPTGVMEFYKAVTTTPYNSDIITSDASRWWLYADSEVAQGRIPKYLMLEIAYDGLDFNEKWSRCKGEYYYFNDESRGRVTDYCVDAARIRDRIKEIFGVEVEFNVDDHVGTHNRAEICGTKDYSVENDEFYTTDDGCGGNDPRHIQHWLTKAEKRGDEIWLYETAVYSDSNSLATIGGNVNDGEIILEDFGEYSQQHNLDYNPRNITDLAITDRFNEYIWKFKKNADGGYVFEGLEKVK